MSERPKDYDKLTDDQQAIQNKLVRLVDVYTTAAESTIARLTQERDAALLRAQIAEAQLAAVMPVVTEVRIYYMHDNHTFSRLHGDIDEVIARATRIALESPYGMLGRS